MALEPNSVQRDRMLTHEKTKLTLVQFLVSKDPALIHAYLSQSRQAVLNEGGERAHLLTLDQALTEGEHPFQFLTVDNFPSSQALLLAHEHTREIRDAALQEIYSFYLKTTSIIKRVVKGAGFFSPTLAGWLGTRQIKEVHDHQDEFDPQTDPLPEAVREFSGRDRDQPFYMMNLNQFSPRNKSRSAGKDVYNRYAAWIIPYLISVGGYPDIYAKIQGTYIGDQRSSLANSWGDFALVYYPSRASFLHLMTNTPRRAAVLRRAGLKKVVLMPCFRLPV